MDTDMPAICPPPMTTIWTQETETLMKEIDLCLAGKVRNIAIISEYLGGRESLAEKIECVHPGRTARVVLDSFVNDLLFLSDIPDSDIVIIENCHYLARRMIGGFLHLTRFIEYISQKQKIWVTTWNTHSFRYLNAVQGIGSLFPVQITLGEKNYRTLRDFILSQHTSSIFYIVDAPVPRRLIMVKQNREVTIPFFKTTYQVPYYTLRLHLLLAFLKGKSHEVDPDELLFERLARISNGNPGIALKIWEETLDAWEIRMSRLTAPKIDLSNPDTAYLLSLIISFEAVLKENLRSVLPADINLNVLLAGLVSSGLVYIRDGRIMVQPKALAAITNQLRRIRMVW